MSKCVCERVSECMCMCLSVCPIISNASFSLYKQPRGEVRRLLTPLRGIEGGEMHPLTPPFKHASTPQPLRIARKAIAEIFRAIYTLFCKNWEK